MYNGASNFVEGVDWVFKLIFGFSFFFLFLITGAMIYFAIRYNRKRNPKPVQVKYRAYLEITWITVPTILVIFLFYYGFTAYQPMLWAPRDAMQVKVIGRMWQWSFEYPGGRQSQELVLPINEAVRLNLHSVDVIHGFFIPDFRVKQDVVPGKNNFMWFRPQKLGSYEILCTAYCGLRHSYMGSKVRVVDKEQFTKWVATLPLASAEPEGLTLLKKNACIGCHSIDGTKLVSVSFRGLFGKTETVVTKGVERKVRIDEAYIITAIYEPDLDIAHGYNKGIMKSYKGLIKEEDANKIITYIKTLK
jgi:cytochrome c oxidase subunit II